jgi:putative phosphoesterase
MPRGHELEIGLISDTHGVLRAGAVAALAGVAHVVHAGDVGTPAVLEALARIAPLTAVRGNNDHGAWANQLPERATLRIGDVRILVVHDRGELARDGRDSEEADVVVSGHSHAPRIERKDGVLYVNPGSAGPRRFRLPIALARLRIGRGGVDARIVELADHA